MLMKILNILSCFSIGYIAILLSLFFFSIGMGLSYLRNAFFKGDPWENSDHLFLRLSGLSFPLFAFLIASVAVSAMSKREEINRSFQTEVESVADMLFLESGLPVDVQKKISNHLKGYLLFIKNKEWPVLEQGKKISHGREYISKALDDLYVYFDAHPDKTFMAQSLIGSLEKINDARKERSQASMKRVHPYMWFVLFVGAVLNLFVSIFFLHKKSSGQIVGIGSLSILLGLIFSMLIGFNSPFVGSLTIEFPDVEKYLSLMTVK